jgi:hypothetical protein
MGCVLFDHPVLSVLYGCANWSLTVKEEHRLMVSENKLRIFGPKRDEITRGCGKLHNEKIHNSYPSGIL